jgi:hypothetical protein
VFPAAEESLPPGFLYGQQPLERFEKFPLPRGIAAFGIKLLNVDPLAGNQRLRARDRLIQLA